MNDDTLPAADAGEDKPTPAHRRKESPPVPAITTYTPTAEPAPADNPSDERGSSDLQGE